MIRLLELESIAFIFIGVIVGIFLIGYTHNTQTQLFSNAAEPMQVAIPIPTPTPVFVATTTAASQISSDGTKKVEVRTTQNEDKTQTYTVSTNDGLSTIFTKTLASDETITIPFNTWSADNRYFFLQEQTKTGPKILVFQATGESFANGAQYLDLTDAFEKHTTGDIFDQATGWAENNLIIINTKAINGTQGSSYWYEVPSEAIIQLSTTF